MDGRDGRNTVNWEGTKASWETGCKERESIFISGEMELVETRQHRSKNRVQVREFHAAVLAGDIRGRKFEKGN